jgi:hypothetical protein
VRQPRLRPFDSADADPFLGSGELPLPVDGEVAVDASGAARATPALGTTVTDGEIQQMMQQEILAGNVPQPTANSLYFVYVPPGVKVVMGGSSSCVQFCGYHDQINRKIFYAVMPYPDCLGCTGSLSAFDALTSTSSHELSEAITDAIPGEGWYDWGNNMEIGDLCAWTTKTVGQYTVQLEWSNKANKCV